VRPMRSVPRQLATFAAVLAVLFAGGYAAGHVIDADSPHHGGAMPAEHAMGEDAPQAVRGLAAAEGGLRLAVPAAALERGREQQVRFQILGEDGAPVTGYDVEHTKRLHLILVRRDMVGFQHLHPQLDDGGVWSATTRFAEAGTYRLFADFSHEGTRYTLAGDVTVRGEAGLQPLPAPEPLATTEDGYDVRLAADDTPAGEHARLAFDIRKDGEPVETEPYLGAAGHLVALRDGDLAFLHVHPDDSGVVFEASFPTAGRYRLFLQFQHAGRVRTVAFTHVVR
jgi:hypothetical protein